jgi:hypothetical protein
VFAIDVAKVDMVAAIAAADGRVLQTICWKAPDQNPAVLLCKSAVYFEAP